jgi:hypothetical protein
VLTPSEERIVRRAARAERAYWKLFKARADDARHRMALIDRRISIDRELRGELAHQPPVEPVDTWVPLRVAVRREIARRYAGIESDVALERERRRLAVDCGYTQLSLSFTARVRRKLRRVIWSSGLAIREVAEAMGVAPSTLERHLAGERPCAARCAWYDRVESIGIEQNHILILLRAGPPARKPYGWRKPLEDDDEAP